MFFNIGQLQHKDLEGIVYQSLARMSSNERKFLMPHSPLDEKYLDWNYNTLTHVIMALWNTVDCTFSKQPSLTNGNNHTLS